MATVNGNIITIGPKGDQWLYHRKERVYDLSRTAGADDGEKLLTVETVQAPVGAPEDRKIVLAPSRTALVIVDMQNFFLHPRCRSHPTGLAAVAPLLQLIRDCRAAGVQIIWLNWGLTDEDLAVMPVSVTNGFAMSMMNTPVSASSEESEAVTPSGLGVDLGDDLGRTLFAGAWNSAVYAGEEGDWEKADGGLAGAVRPDLGDLLCPKNRMSGLWSTETALWRMLQAETPQTKTLLFTGVNTDQCVQGTLVDAYNGGWDCVAVADCCATTSPGAHEVTLWNVANNYGFVIDSKTFAKGVGKYTEA